MLEGQFFDIPLSNSQYACGRVLQFDYSSGKKDSRSFLAGLMDWTGDQLPNADSIAKTKLLYQGNVHIRTIAFIHGQIRGFRSLEEDGIEPLLELSHMPVNDCWLKRGYEWLRPATLEERQTLYIQSTWGLGVIAIKADMYFVKKTPPVRRLPWEELVESLGYFGSNDQAG
jgi:hypothetical protein